MWNHAILSPHLLEDHPASVHRKGAALDNCFGFVPISWAELGIKEYCTVDTSKYTL